MESNAAHAGRVHVLACSALRSTSREVVRMNGPRPLTNRIGNAFVRHLAVKKRQLGV